MEENKIKNRGNEMINCEPLREKERYKSSGYDYDKCFYAKDVASAVAFYKRYKDKSALLLKEKPKAYSMFKKRMLEIIDGKYDLIEFNDWLLDYCFQDVI